MANENPEKPAETHTDPITRAALHDKATLKLKQHQDLPNAIIGGLCSALLSAVLWAVITVATGYQIGYMAIAVGLLVGFSVQYFGAGIDKIFGIIGGAFALSGCLLGNLLSQVGFTAQAESLGYVETLAYLNFSVIMEVLSETFNPIDILFYGLAIYEGYRFAFRRVTEATLERIYRGEHDGQPAYSRLRMPLAVACIALLSGLFFILNQGVSGPKIYYYESGAKMAEGELKNSKLSGRWVQYYESGKEHSIGYYEEGKQDSLWQWYDETGLLMKQGSYLRGIEHGIWIVYHKNGVASDSGYYHEGRMQGRWKYWYENGQVSRNGFYKRHMPDSLWITYYDNGRTASVGHMKEAKTIGRWEFYYDNGQLSEILEYQSPDSSLILNSWDPAGIQLVKDGFGNYKSYSTLTGKVLQEGLVENGRKLGNWVFYYESGSRKEEGVFEKGLFLLANAWKADGSKMVSDGNGMYTSYFADGTTFFESGEVRNGYRTGMWTVYYETSGNVLMELWYNNGLVSGPQKNYYETGELFSEGVLSQNLREGEWKWYHMNGIVSSSVTFVKDKKEGKQTMWSEDGEKTKEEFYEHGVLVKETLL